MSQTKNKLGRVFSGMQPTGSLHLGNYLGALKNWLPLQETHECFFCIVDLHAITLPQDPEELYKSTLKSAALYIASGIDPQKSIIFPQSTVQEHTYLMWLLSCVTPLGWLNRMTQFKDKAKTEDLACLGLYSYPVLQAADILLYQATHVPVGEDQKQHLELCRDIAGAFNRQLKLDYFTLPAPTIHSSGARVMSLRDGMSKMSKSDPSDYSRINLLDTPEIIQKKIKKAKTDPLPFPSSLEELEGRPEIKNLTAIFSAISDKSNLDIIHSFSGESLAGFKKALSEVCIEELSSIRARYLELMEDKTYLLEILKNGERTAREIASKTIGDVKKLIGLF